MDCRLKPGNDAAGDAPFRNLLKRKMLRHVQRRTRASPEDPSIFTRQPKGDKCVMDFTQKRKSAGHQGCGCGFDDACRLNKDSEGGFPIISALPDLEPSRMRLMTNGGLI